MHLFFDFTGMLESKQGCEVLFSIQYEDIRSDPLSHWTKVTDDCLCIQSEPIESYSKHRVVTQTPLHIFFPLYMDVAFSLLKVKVLVVQGCWTLSSPWNVVPQAVLCMGSSRQESCSVLPCPFPGDLPDPEVESGSSAPH